MPTIRRPSWRPRIMHGHKVESFKTNDNDYLERDEQFRIANITPDARKYILNCGWNIWFIRRPGYSKNFATLLEPVPALQPLQDSLKTHGHIRLTYDLPEGLDEFELTHLYYVNTSNMWKYSFVDGKARPYLGAYKENLFLDVKAYLYWADVSREDQDALASVE